MSNQQREEHNPLQGSTPWLGPGECWIPDGPFGSSGSHWYDSEMEVAARPPALSYTDCSWADTEEGSYRNVAASIILERAMKCFMKYRDLWNLWVKHWQQPTGLSYRQLFCYTSQDHVPLSCICPGHTGRVQDSCSSPDNTFASVFLWGTGFFKYRQLSIICAFHWAGKTWIVEERCMIWALGRALQ